MRRAARLPPGARARAVRAHLRPKYRDGPRSVQGEDAEAAAWAWPRRRPPTAGRSAGRSPGAARFPAGSRSASDPRSRQPRDPARPSRGRCSGPQPLAPPPAWAASPAAASSPHALSPLLFRSRLGGPAAASRREPPKVLINGGNTQKRLTGAPAEKPARAQAPAGSSARSPRFSQGPGLRFRRRSGFLSPARLLPAPESRARAPRTRAGLAGRPLGRRPSGPACAGL